MDHTPFGDVREYQSIDNRISILSFHRFYRTCMGPSSVLPSFLRETNFLHHILCMCGTICIFLNVEAHRHRKNVALSFFQYIFVRPKIHLSIQDNITETKSHDFMTFMSIDNQITFQIIEVER